MNGIHGIYLSLPMTDKQYDRYCLWQAKQWIAYEIKTARGLSVFASIHPFPSKALNAQQVA